MSSICIGLVFCSIDVHPLANRLLRGGVSVVQQAVDVLRFFLIRKLDLLHFLIVCDIFAPFLVGAQ